MCRTSRAWTNTAGKTITAAFVRFTPLAGKFQIEKGRQVELPLASLSGNDVDWIKEHVPEAMSNQSACSGIRKEGWGRSLKSPLRIPIRKPLPITIHAEGGNSASRHSV